jgi:aspartate aminotransferase
LPKAYAIIGWRLGRGIGPREPIDTMVGVQGQSTFDASSILLASALTGSRDVFGECLEPLKGRRDFIISELNKTDRSDCLIPVGAVYAFPCCVKTFGFKMPNGTEITSYAEFCPYLLKAAVAVVPSHAFGLSGHFRLSYAYAMAELKQSCARITKAVAALSQRIIECH